MSTDLTKSAPARGDIRFGPPGNQLAAWYYPAMAGNDSVCIVMAHGFGANRYYGLSPFAESFQGAGYACLVFDYRNFGDSDGHPRGHLNISQELEDWKSAIEHARSMSHKRIVLWGTSLAGGHVLNLAAKLDDIAGVISQVPHVDGYASVSQSSISQILKIGSMAIADRLFSLFGHHLFVKTFADIGNLAAMTRGNPYASLIQTLPQYARHDARSWKEYFDDNNKVNAFSLLSLLFYSPGNKANKIHCPVLIQAGEKDQTTPFLAAKETAQRIRSCTFISYPIDHFDIYLGEDRQLATRDQITFLKTRIKANVGTTNELPNQNSHRH